MIYDDDDDDDDDDEREMRERRDEESSGKPKLNPTEKLNRMARIKADLIVRVVLQRVFRTKSKFHFPAFVGQDMHSAFSFNFLENVSFENIMLITALC